MQPFDQAWQLLKSYSPFPHLRPSTGGYFPRAHRDLSSKMPPPRGGRFFQREPRPTPPAENHAALANLSDEELKQMAAESERIHREEMQREYMDDLERREAAGNFVPTDLFDEGGNAAAGEGYMSGGRRY